MEQTDDRLEKSYRKKTAIETGRNLVLAMEGLGRACQQAAKSFKKFGQIRVTLDKRQLRRLRRRRE